MIAEKQSSVQSLIDYRPRVLNHNLIDNIFAEASPVMTMQECLAECFPRRAFLLHEPVPGSSVSEWWSRRVELMTTGSQKATGVSVWKTDSAEFSVTELVSDHLRFDVTDMQNYEVAQALAKSPRKLLSFRQFCKSQEFAFLNYFDKFAFIRNPRVMALVEIDFYPVVISIDHCREGNIDWYEFQPAGIGDAVPSTFGQFIFTPPVI